MGPLALGLLALFLLVAFGVPALRQRGTGRPTRRGDTTVRPLYWHVADALFVLAWVLLVAGAALDTRSGVTGPRIAAGLIVMAAAVALLTWAQRTMGIAWRPDIPPVADGALVTTGPFALVRNPNYVAMLGAGAAIVVLSGGIVALSAWAVLLLSLAWTARAEEPPLAARYGQAYATYAARVGRFLPGVGRLPAGRGLRRHAR